MAALAFYLFGSGVALTALTVYWEGLPLGPRDGQAFMGPGLLGLLFTVVALFVAAGVVAATPRGPIALLVAFVVGALSVFVGITIGQSILFVAGLPFAVLVAMAVRSPRPAALRALVVATLTVVAFAAFAFVSGPLPWMTKGLDASVLVVWIALAVLTVAGALILRSGRLLAR
jgi:hypothetical protein